LSLRKGSNGLANAHHFETPVASYEDLSVDYELVQKFQGNLFSTTLDHSPFDVVAWHGNYAPYKYDLKKYCAAGSVSYDHLVCLVQFHREIP
jgi:homogentisate 1,2-dioxygenase